jgi:hypothetical protein
MSSRPRRRKLGMREKRMIKNLKTFIGERCSRQRILATIKKLPNWKDSTTKDRRKHYQRRRESRASPKTPTPFLAAESRKTSSTRNEPIPFYSRPFNDLFHFSLQILEQSGWNGFIAGIGAFVSLGRSICIQVAGLTEMI